MIYSETGLLVKVDTVTVCNLWSVGITGLRFRLPVGETRIGRVRGMTFAEGVTGGREEGVTRWRENLRNKELGVVEGRERGGTNRRGLKQMVMHAFSGFLEVHAGKLCRIRRRSFSGIR